MPVKSLHSEYCIISTRSSVVQPLYSKKSKYKIHTLCNILPPPKQWHSSSLFTRGKGQNLVIRLLKTPLGFLNFSTRKMPSFPGWISLMTGVGYCNGLVLSSLIRTRSPGCRLGKILCQRWSCCGLWNYSVDKSCQSCHISFWYVCHLECLLQMKLIKSAAGNC